MDLMLPLPQLILIETKYTHCQLDVYSLQQFLPNIYAKFSGFFLDFFLGNYQDFII